MTVLICPHQVDEFGNGDLSDWLLHATQRLQWGAKAAGKVVARDGDKIVFATVQVEYQNVLYRILPGVQQCDRVFADINLEINFQGLICLGREGEIQITAN